MEYAPAGTFTMRPHCGRAEEGLPAVQVQSMRRMGGSSPSTSAMTLRYRLGSGAFTAANLSVTWNDPAGGRTRLASRDVDSLNLGGLTYSLDNISKTIPPRRADGSRKPGQRHDPGIDVLLARRSPGC